MDANSQSTSTKGRLTYPCGEVPATGSAKEIAPGVWWIRMPLPFSLDHINVWAVRDGSGWALIDTGVWSNETATVWRSLFAEIFQGPITRVLVTHMHPDHIGMAGWLTRKFDCRLWITRLEYLHCRVLHTDTGRAVPNDGIRFYQRAGWSEDSIEGYRTRFGGFGKMIYSLPDSYRRLHDGEEFHIDGNSWHVVVGAGHSPEHACLYCPNLKLLIAGDQILPRISSNVSVFPMEPDANPLADWLSSLDKIRYEVPDDVLVLPAHNEPFQGLHSRVGALSQSHSRSLERLRETLRQPRRVIDVYGALFARKITPSDHDLMSLATGESLAHLNYLVARGEASVRIDDGDVAWYQMTSQPHG